MPNESAASDPWRNWRFLLGDWVGESEGRPGAGVGGFTFALELAEKLLVRRSRTDFPATQDRPASKHEDLTLIYTDPAGGDTRAIYFDDEGHVIRYAVTFSPDRQELTFLSELDPAAPRFRLSYRRAGDDALAVSFDIAPPGQPFSTYTAGVVRRA